MARKIKSEKYISERKTKAGSTFFEVRIRSNDGQDFRRSFSVKEYGSRTGALDEAKRCRDKALNDIRIGRTVTRVPTVKTIYERSYSLFPVRYSTQRKHGFFYKLAIEKYADIPLNEITSADIQESINSYAETHTKKDTSDCLSLWKRIYNTAELMNIELIDRTKIVKVPSTCKPTRKKSNLIDKEEYEAFMSALWEYGKDQTKASYRNRSVWYSIRVQQFTGMRPAEAYGLQEADIDFIRGMIHINKEVGSSVNSEKCIRSTKTEQSIRYIPVSEELKPILKEAIERAKGKPFLFTDISGNLIDSKESSTVVNLVSRKTKIHFHQYIQRHTFSTVMLEKVSPVAVRDLMGHSSQTMTLDYGESTEKDRRNAIAAVKLN